MLVLSRKVGESFYINDDVVVRIIEIRGHQAILGIDAPKEVKILREEIYETIQKGKVDEN